MPLYQEDYTDAAARLKCSVAAIRAVAETESNGAGIKNGVLVKRFEPAVFEKRTGKTAANYDAAYKINPIEAMMSTSWGAFQVMGFNFKEAGYNSVQTMVAAYGQNEQNQISSFVTLILAWGLDDELRGLKWAAFAYRYNGPGYKANNYDGKMDTYYKKYLPDPLAGLKKKVTVPIWPIA